MKKTLFLAGMVLAALLAVSCGVELLPRFKGIATHLRLPI